MTKTKTTDRIEKDMLLRAPRTRVWRALTDTGEFNAWFGVALEGPFAVGAKTRGKITMKGLEQVMLEVTVVELKPESLFSYRWHPYAVDPETDYSAEPTTLCEFHLDEVNGGTRLRVVESGFDRLPASRRDEAFRMNDGGWDGQLGKLGRYVAE